MKVKDILTNKSNNKNKMKNNKMSKTKYYINTIHL